MARRSELVDQSSGVSARMPIAARELLVSNLERRALRTGETVVAPRLVDLFAHAAGPHREGGDGLRRGAAGGGDRRRRS